MNLSTNTINIRPFVFSSDQNDVGIISFQKSDYKAILAYIKQNSCVPLPIQSIDNMDDNNAGDKISTVGFPALPGNTSTNAVVSKGKIGSINKSFPYFTGELDVYPGNSGGPVIKNNKLIGILSFQSGTLTNIDAAMHPFDKAASATVIKASVILPLLKELQQHENDPLFR